MTVRTLVIGALLTALSLIIPIVFSFLFVAIPPVFTGTLASHVPQMLAMAFGPAVAGAVGVASTVGFLITKGPIIAARASIHILFGIAGALLMRRGHSMGMAGLLVMPIHAIGEALAVIPFGIPWKVAGLTVGVGSVIHHFIDLAMALGIVAALRAARIRVL